jgi:GntR family transcriptional regulator, N-acetylglucosamine utilization regulator
MKQHGLISRLNDVVMAGNVSVPLYRRLSDAVATMVGTGELRLGDPLPGERVLAEELDVSRVTIRKAIKVLEDEGLVRRRQGTRTEVASHVEKSLSTLTSFSEDISSRGMRPGCIWISKEIGRPTPIEMMALGIANSQNVVRLKRIRTADELPIAIETSAVPSRFLPSPDLVAESLYETLGRLDALPSRAVQRMRSRPASEVDAQLLGCEAGAPLLMVERRCFLANEQIVEFSETRYRGDVYDFVVELRR